MTRLSVNINKIATLRNARGGNNPDVVQVAIDCERFGAQGITIHPRPDERHIRFSDAIALKNVVKTEFNIEGYPDSRYLEIISMTRPDQATLVPDAPDAITSNAGWDTLRHKAFLAADVGADRVELYTEPYASRFMSNKEEAIRPYILAAEAARKAGMGLNAGHDLDLKNLKYLKMTIPFIDEVSIGHALICDAIYYGLENTIQMYLRQLQS